MCYSFVSINPVRLVRYIIESSFGNRICSDLLIIFECSMMLATHVGSIHGRLSNSTVQRMPVTYLDGNLTAPRRCQVHLSWTAQLYFT